MLDSAGECDPTWLTEEAMQLLADSRVLFGVAKLVLKDKLPFDMQLPPDGQDDSKTDDEKPGASGETDGEVR